jgi:hypothetical protein
MNFKLLIFLWVIFALLDLDPDSEFRSGSTDLIESRLETLLKGTGTFQHNSSISEKVFGPKWHSLRS